MKSFENRTRPIVFLLASTMMALLVMCTPAVKGQSTGGRIRGTVTDPSGGAVVGAKVVLVNEAERGPRERANRSDRRIYVSWKCPSGV